MKVQFEKLRAKQSEIDSRIAAARAEIDDAKRIAAEADAELAAAVTDGRDAGPARKKRAEAVKHAEEIAETIRLIEAGSAAVLAPLGAAVIEAAPEAFAQVQAEYNQAIEEARKAWTAYQEAKAKPRKIEASAAWMISAQTVARALCEDKRFFCLDTINIDHAIEGRI